HARRVARRGDLVSAKDGAADLVNGAQIAGLEPQIDSAGRVRVIPAGSVADHVIVRDGETIVRLTFDTRPVRVDNIGRLPMAWIDPDTADTRVILAEGAETLAGYRRGPGGRARRA